MWHHVKYLILSLLLLLGCKQETFVSDDLLSNEFDQDGRVFAYYQFNSTSLQKVYLSIPSGSVASKKYVEYYTVLLDDSNPLDSFKINYTRGDINIFRSSATTLNNYATLTIPFPNAVNFSLADGYKPYKIIIQNFDSMYEELNNPANRTEINYFIFDNVAKTITFEVNDINACYVIAKQL